MIRILLLCFFLLTAFSCSKATKKMEESSNSTPSGEMESFDETTPVDLPMHTLSKDYALRPWVAPIYKGQKNVIGWTESSFQVPEKMEKAVSFWFDIYSKYNSWEGILHDSRYIDLVYAKVDFKDIMQNKELNQEQRNKERRNRLEEKRNEIILALENVASKKSSLSNFEIELERRIADKIPAEQREQELVELNKKGRLRFQLGQKDYIYQGIVQSGAYMDSIEEIFASHNLPKELTRIVFVESSFNLNARSKVGASGVWQIMPSTGKAKGLARNYFYDYRNHPLEAAHAAAKLLKFNYRILENWPMALTAYNYGAAGIRRLSKELKTDKIEDMIDHRGGRWGFAAANFYASYLAVMRLESDLLKYYGSDYKYRAPLDASSLRLSKNIKWSQLKQWIANLEEFKELNPQFNFSRFKSDLILRKGLVVYFPTKDVEKVAQGIKDAPKVQVSGSHIVHVVERGQTLSGIARTYGTSVSQILANNQLDSKSMIRTGQDLIIPLPKQ